MSAKRHEFVVSMETVDVGYERPRFAKTKKRVTASDADEAEQTARSLVRAANKDVRVVAIKNILKVEEGKSDG